MRYPSFSASTHTSPIASCLILAVLQAISAPSAEPQARVPLQPFALQVRQVETTLGYLGQPLPQQDQDAISEAIAKTDEAAAISGLEEVLDKYVVAIVDIYAESRVQVRPGSANLELVEAGTRVFLSESYQ